jgi:DNA-binding MarR family transcriptional regulator
MSGTSVDVPFRTVRRREVARACSFGPRTATDVARQLATDSGSVTTVLSRLEQEGILRPAAAPHSRAQAYELVESWRPALLESIESDAPRGQLLHGRRLLLVGARDAAALARIAPAIATDPIVLWAARVDGPVRLVIAVRGDETSERAQVDRLQVVIEAEGLECVQLRIDGIMELAELREYAKVLSVPTPVPELGQGEPG